MMILLMLLMICLIPEGLAINPYIVADRYYIGAPRFQQIYQPRHQI